MTEYNFDELLKIAAQAGPVGDRDPALWSHDSKKMEKKANFQRDVELLVGKIVHYKLTLDMSEFPHDYYERFGREYGQRGLLIVVHVLGQMAAKELQAKNQDPDLWFEVWNGNAHNQHQEDMDFIKWSESMQGEGLSE